MGENNLSSFEEKLLIERAKAGDNEALSLLLQNNYQLLIGYFLKITGSRELALDLTQETMLRAIEKIYSFGGRSKLSTWLITIGTNIYRDWLRKKKREEEELFNLWHKDYPKPHYHGLDDILQDLPPQKRLPLVLKYYYDFTYEEIACILEIPLGTVRSRLHYTILELREKLR